jgi:hypothetical protein
VGVGTFTSTREDNNHDIDRRSMMVRTVALLLAISVSGCMTPGTLPKTSSPDLPKIQKVEMAPIGVPAGPRVRILNSDSDWFHIPGFVAKGAYVGYAGGEVGALLKSVGFDYGREAARLFERSFANSGLSVARSDAAVLSEHRGWSLSKCPKQTEADACLDVYLTYFGYVAAFDSSNYVPTAHVSARVIERATASSYSSETFTTTRSIRAERSMFSRPMNFAFTIWTQCERIRKVSLPD